MFAVLREAGSEREIRNPKSQFEKATLDFQWLQVTKHYLNLRERKSEPDKEAGNL